MRIGIVSPFNPNEFRYFFPGVETPKIHETANAVHALVKSFIEAGHTVTVFSMSLANKHEEYLSNQLRVYLVPFRAIPRTSIFQVFFIKKLRNVIKEHLDEIDVLHAQWTYQYAYAAMIFAKKKPTFCTVRDWCPYILTTLSGWGKFYWRHINYPIFLRVMGSDRMHFIANSPYTYSCIKSDYPAKDVVVIPNSVKNDLILKERNKVPDHLIITTIANGVDDPRKNITTLLRAFRMLRKDIPCASLYLVGRKDDRYPLYKQWQDDGLLDGVSITGSCSHDDVIKYLDCSTMMVHPSLEETFGNTLIEAMARRVPVVGGKDSGAVPYVLGNGKYGVCCDVSDADEVYKSICYLLIPENSQKLVENATCHLINTYASDIVCKLHIDYYDKIINECRQPLAIVRRNNNSYTKP